MNPSTLYELYRDGNAAQGILVEEEWDDLDERDQAVWAYMAECLTLN